MQDDTVIAATIDGRPVKLGDLRLRSVLGTVRSSATLVSFSEDNQQHKYFVVVDHDGKDIIRVDLTKLEALLGIGSRDD